MGGPSALAEVEGPAAALNVLNDLELETFYLFPDIRVDVLRRLGRPADAVSAYDEALTLITNVAERTFLQRARGTIVATG